MKRVLVAMSGGVDSAVSALLLKQQGYDVCGTTLILNDNYSDAEDAKLTAQKIGIDFFVVDRSQIFKNNVIDPFVDSYCCGLTPNPCICCNKKIKFGELYNEALDRGFDALATGHYARISWNDMTDEPALTVAADREKDQSYVLYPIRKEYFRNILFPLGGFTKAQVRNIAESFGFEVAKKSDSQDICFIKDGDYSAFIRSRLDKCAPKGFFVDINGNVLGEHKGQIAYTVGQRRGLGISAEAPLYVIRKNAVDNTIVLGFEDQLMVDHFDVCDVNILCESECRGTVECSVRTRYHQNENLCSVVFSQNGARVHTKSKIRRPAPGQSAVFYKGDKVIAGGIIE